MNAKLTNYTRDKISLAVLEHRFQKQVEVLCADRAAFAVDVYNDIYRKSDREKMAALPADWLCEASAVKVQFGDGKGFVSLAFDGGVYGKVGKVRVPTDDRPEYPTRRVLHKHEHGCAKVYDADHRLAMRHAVLSERFEALNEAIETAERQIKAAINSATTAKRLVELWPEVAPFIPAEVKRDLPALPVASLNKLLDLPVAA